MTLTARKFWTISLTVLAIAGLLAGMILPYSNLTKVQAAEQKQGTTPPYVSGPFVDQTVSPTVFNGDLRDLPQTPSAGGEVPAPGIVKQPDQGDTSSSSSWIDPVVQESIGQGQMPDPIMNFDGLIKSEGGGWIPPDTNGDVGPNHYIQVVNIAIGIYDKTTGAALVKLSYNDFFQGPPGSPCDNQNRGDVVVLYDPQVDRWIVTDFSLPDGGPYYECIAVSQSGDPVGGGWYYYAVQANTPPFADAFNDYPKLGVWSDGWYMSANMWTNIPEGVRVWALDRADALIGVPMDVLAFDCTNTSYCDSLLPANIRGTLPPAGSPEYFANVVMPSTLNLWQFHADFDTPGNSTFTGPVALQVANFNMATSVPQLGTTQFLASLGDRMMMQLQYRNLNGVEALYANHSVVSGGVDGIRWYEIRDPGGDPILFQQGTYQPDQNYRWMGSIAADGEGNIAVGYSVSSAAMYPAIRFAGRLAGEIPNLLTQNETTLFQGAGSQSGSNRWGDYSAMTVDPVDDCTFWYTQEYASSGINWRTRIGSFKFPSCGQPKGTISGYVYNSVTNQPVAGVPVFAAGASYNFSSLTDQAGFYSMDLVSGSYDLTAGPLLPGYPGTDVVNGVVVVAGAPTDQDFHLAPASSLVHADVLLNDPSGNNNGFPEPGEQGLQLSESLYNQGAITATQIIAKLTSLTNGVTIDTADATYADIAAGDSGFNSTPYVFSLDYGVACGTELNFQAVVTDSFSTYNTAFSLNASIPLPRQNVFTNTVEGGPAGWTAGGYPNTWAITTESAHSLTHSWTDSPGSDYANYANTFVRTPAYDLSGKRHVQLSGWFKYALEMGFDEVYIEYSLNGGSNWEGTKLATFTGVQDWNFVSLDTSVLDNQPNVALRFRLASDQSVTKDGMYVDDVALSYEPYECSYVPMPNAPTLVSPADGSWLTSPVTFVWEPAASGVPAEGYIFYLDVSPVLTFTTPITSTTLDVSSWGHTWFVKATNPSGVSLKSATWSFDVFGKFFLPITQK